MLLDLTALAAETGYTPSTALVTLLSNFCGCYAILEDIDEDCYAFIDDTLKVCDGEVVGLFGVMHSRTHGAGMLASGGLLV